MSCFYVTRSSVFTNICTGQIHHIINLTSRNIFELLYPLQGRMVRVLSSLPCHSNHVIIFCSRNPIKCVPIKPLAPVINTFLFIFPPKPRTAVLINIVIKFNNELIVSVFVVSYDALNILFAMRWACLP